MKLKQNGKNYALKEMSKVKIIDKKSENSIIGERDFLSKLRHPFIINMICAFQDYENLYLLLDYLPGGDLRYHYNLGYSFTENQIRFFISCLILSLEYIHSNNIIHRDIKPENLVFDEKGYLCLTDFGVAKIIKNEHINDTSGTPGYMAPEVIHGKNHSFPVDFWAIGVIGYELILGRRPYKGKSRKEIKKLLAPTEKDILIEPEDNKNNRWSKECIDFINKCLKKNVEMRIGYSTGIKELKSHEWFDRLDWKKLYNKNIETSYVPVGERNFDKIYCENNDKITTTTLERYKDYMKKDNYMKIFEGYTFYNNDVTHNTLENETMTRVSTSRKTNNKEIVIVENNTNSGNIFVCPNIVNNNYNKKTSLNINKNEDDNMSKNLVENKISDNIQNKETSILNGVIKEKKIKKILIKNKQNHDLINLNKKLLLNEISDNNINENNCIPEIKNINKKNDRINDFQKENKKLILNNIINSKIKVAPIKINNNIKLFNEKIIHNDIDTELKNYQNNNNTSEINVLNIKKNVNSSINLMENTKINIPRINFMNTGKKKLNIHNLSVRDLKEKSDHSNILKENIKKSFSSNNYLLYHNIFGKGKKYNKSPNNAFVLPDIRHFNFHIPNKKKIRHMYLNQNRIIENNINTNNTNNTNKENKHSKILEKYILPNNNKFEKFMEETYQKNQTNDLNIKLIKSQSSVFPILNNNGKNNFEY